IILFISILMSQISYLSLELILLPPKTHSMAISFADKDINALKQLLSTPRNIVITTHHRPDGDAIGSSLGLYHYLKLSNHTVTVVTPSDFPDFLHWMTGVDKIIDFGKNAAEAIAVTESADIIFCLDFNQLN